MKNYFNQIERRSHFSFLNNFQISFALLIINHWKEEEIQNSDPDCLFFFSQKNSSQNKFYIFFNSIINLKNKSAFQLYLQWGLNNRYMCEQPDLSVPVGVNEDLQAISFD